VFSYCASQAISQNSLQYCSEDVLVVCPDGMFDPMPPACGIPANPILRNNLGNGINYNPATQSFQYTDSQGILQNRDIFIEKSGLIRTFIARVPDLNRNGVQRSYRSGELRWRYFRKRYYYNVSIRSRQNINTANQNFNNSCWEELLSGELWQKFDDIINRNEVGFISWVKSAERPGTPIPLNRIMLPTGVGAFQAPAVNGCISISYNAPLPLNGQLNEVNTVGAIVRLINNFPAIANPIISPYVITLGNFIQWVPGPTATGVAPGLTTFSELNVPQIIGTDLNARSPDNICLYGTEMPVLGVDYN